jgi:magnesium-transporting ATPase (P-type)
METIADRFEPKEDLESLSLPELEARLGWTPDGLSHTEAQRRLEQYGYNELAEKTANALAWFFINDRVKLAAYRVVDLTGPTLLGAKRGGLSMGALHNHGI